MDTVRHDASESNHRILSRRTLIAGMYAFALTAPLAAALLLPATSVAAEDGGLIAADAAHRQAKREALTIFDVRSPGEWRQTGVPAGARRVTIHDPGGLAGFVAAMKRAVDGDLDRPVAVICARGNRSTRARKALRAAGFKNVGNIREGMLGSAFGPGWLGRGLPVER